LQITIGAIIIVASIIISIEKPIYSDLKEIEIRKINAENEVT
jgi:hypothetical protein